MGMKVAAGWLAGAPIRKARKAHRCDYWHGASNGGNCKRGIAAGAYYVEGEPNEHAGGFGNDRYCMECAGPEARDALAAATGLKAEEVTP